MAGNLGNQGGVAVVLAVPAGIAQPSVLAIGFMFQKGNWYCASALLTKCSDAQTHQKAFPREVLKLRSACCLRHVLKSLQGDQRFRESASVPVFHEGRGVGRNLGHSHVLENVPDILVPVKSYERMPLMSQKVLQHL